MPGSAVAGTAWILLSLSQQPTARRGVTRWVFEGVSSASYTLFDLLVHGNHWEFIRRLGTALLLAMCWGHGLVAQILKTQCERVAAWVCCLQGWMQTSCLPRYARYSKKANLGNISWPPTLQIASQE